MHKNIVEVIAFFILIFSQEVFSDKACNISKNDLSDYVISDNGKTLVYINQTDNCMQIKDGVREKILNFSEFEKIKDVRPNISAELSFDSKFLAVQFDAAESTHLVKVIALDSLREVFESTATNAVWMKESNQLLIVPNFGIDEMQTMAGLYVYNVETNTKKIVADAYFFTGKVITGGDLIIGDIVETHNKTSIFRTVIFDLKNNKSI